jgi:hypothetical protein
VPDLDLLYDGGMGYSTAISHELEPDRWIVSVRVDLNRAETNELFLSGDSILSWPVEGLLPSSGEGSIPDRSSMFVSEVAAQPQGLAISYSDQTYAQRTLVLLRAQFAEAGIKEKV